MANLKLNKNDNHIEVIITESGEKWKKLIIKSKGELFKNLELKGFRKGNVPPAIAEKNISQNQIWHKAADLLIESEYSKAIELLMTEKIATKPTFQVNKVTDSEIEAVLKAILIPEVKIGNRSSIKIDFKADEVKINKEEIDAEIEQLDQLLTKNEDIEDSNIIVKDGDLTNIDFLGKVEGIPFEGGESKSFDLKIGSKSFIDGFEEQVIGMKKNETKEINVKFPEQYPSENLAGKEATFIVKLNAIKKTIKLKDEELKTKLKSLGFDSREEIISRIKEVALEKKQEIANDEYFRLYIDKIIELPDTKISIPNEILEQEVEQEYKRVEAQIVKQKMNMKEYLKMMNMSSEDFKDKMLKSSSLKRIKDGLIYSKLVEELNIKVSESDLESEYSKLAKNSKTSVENIKKQINTNSIESNITYLKLIKAIKQI